ncbi:hypothetical protein SRHO_G00301720 [Serrasalmus rhombeus]
MGRNKRGFLQSAPADFLEWFVVAHQTMISDIHMKTPFHDATVDFCYLTPGVDCFLQETLSRRDSVQETSCCPQHVNEQ